ncbi:WD40/YVTN/BNR-like repeat-containing protein [Spirosoma linguale]|uniref:Glycosyl hydrolase, BNR repeat-containing protein n=1 Tax=Spirosoma linguale (strain ATCC 33905 / DSM 74 / LMG 10896 / Claus 1) TaxID=504472 RepID=D2QP06_SPILD|nr:glycosyl hydrolase, BNR repeat-containing protein [Spirosoma linguale DSM 74]
MRNTLLVLYSVLLISPLLAQKPKLAKPVSTSSIEGAENIDPYFKPVKWRNIGPFRGGRSVAGSGVTSDPQLYYMGTVGGGIWKTEDAGMTWKNVSDGQLKTSSVGAIGICESDPAVVYVGMGEHAPRGVMTSYGDGVYKSTDAGKTWQHLGLDLTRHIAAVRVHPQNPDVAFVAAQGALHGSSADRGIYKTIDGGKSWKKVLFVDENTGCNDLSMDMTNPRILYASMWDYRRLPWQVQSGGKGSGLYKSTDAGETWTKLEKGLPKELGKMGISVSKANPNRVYAVIESDSKADKGGVFLSEDAGKSWNRVSKDHRTIQRAWYYIEIFADPVDENTVYVLNTSVLKSIDGGKTFSTIPGSHGDHHHLWINPKNNKNLFLSNDGGAAVSFNGGKSWSSENNQPTAQFYRVNADNRFPYYVYGGQQDNTSVMIASRSTNGSGITDKDWEASAGGESAFLAFNPDDPRHVMGGSYQGTIEVLDQQTHEGKPIMVSPIQYQALQAKTMKYRFNWNAPIIWSKHEPNAFYHAGNRLFKTTDLGKSWSIASPDLTRHDSTKLGWGGAPYTNEGAGGENYATITYVLESPSEKGVIWTGSDDGLVYLTRDGGTTWTNVTPSGLPETLINSIEVSPHDKATAYIATTRYKFNDFAPAIYKTTDYGKTWTKIVTGIPYGAFTRTVREDPERKGLLYAGTETGVYVSYNGGTSWRPMQLNLPVSPVTDLKVHQGDLIAATAGRSFWILDDLGPIRQFDDKASKDSLLVYKPEDAYRVSGGSALDKVIEDDDDEDAGSSPGRNGFAGTNPSTGVVMYYQLPAKVDTSAMLTMEILSDQGVSVRKLSSKKDKKFVAFPGGPSPEPTLTVKPGLNRFVWDMRAETLPAIEKVFIEGNYKGRKLPPGAYKATIKFGKQEKTVPFKILPDPRLNTTPADYEQQQKTLIGIEDGVKEIHLGVNRMRKAQKQINDLVDLIDDKPNLKAVADSGRALAKKIKLWEEKVIQPKSQSNDDVINFENKLSADYIFLKGELDVNTPYVTAGQKERLSELNAIWQPLKTDMNMLIQNDIARFNNQCRQAQLEKVTVPDVAVSTPKQ